MELHFPWLELTVLTPLIGALTVFRLKDHEVVRNRSILFLAATLVFALAAWADFAVLGGPEDHDPFDLIGRIAGRPVLLIDTLSGPLLPLGALLYLVTAMATPRTKVRRFSFAWNLVGCSILLATFCCHEPGELVLLLTLGTIPPLIELRDRQKPTRVFAIHMGLFVCLITAGWWLTRSSGPDPSLLGVLCLLAGVLVRTGIVPVHCWLTDLFEHATFGTSLLFVTPMVGAYAAVHLVLPIAPGWVIRSLAIASLITSIYAAAMATVQKEARRFFCYILLSHASLILVGLETATPVGLTGSLTVWLSDALALAGFGLTLRSTEARIGRVSLANYHGLYEHTPTLAMFFLLTGLASVGFPGAFGFVGSELLVDGAVEAYPSIGTVVVLIGALNGIAVMRAYFRLFTGVRHASSISLGCGAAERVAVMILTVLIIVGGLFPQRLITSRHHAASEIVEARERRFPPDKPEPPFEDVAAVGRAVPPSLSN